MTTDEFITPAGWQRAGHIALETGEIAAVHTNDERVALALFAMGDTEPADGMVTPAPVILLTPSEAVTLGALVRATGMAMNAENKERP